MTSIEKTAKTAEEAIQLALGELGATREQVEVEILAEGRPLFGILGSAQTRVRVTVTSAPAPPSPSLAPSPPPSPPPAAPPPAAPPAAGPIGERATRMLSEMMSHMGIQATAEVVEEDDEQVVVDIRGEELGLLIGKHGQTLAAIQHLLGLMVNKGEEYRKRVILDAEGYRRRREESLRHLAIASARRAKQSGEAITLDPLLPHERRIVHTALAEDPGVTTRSIGEEPTRRIVIEPRGGGEPASDGHGPRRESGYARREEPSSKPPPRDTEGLPREEDTRLPGPQPEPQAEEAGGHEDED